MLNKKIEAFMVYVILFTSKIIIYSAKKAQIACLPPKSLLFSKKYVDFANVFFKKLVKVLSKHIIINKHIIKLKKNKQPPYKSIYSLGLGELKIFKIYIKTHLANSFIMTLKFPANTLILFV